MEPIVIRLELRLTDQSVDGRAIGAGSTREFAGWLGLVTAVDALASAAARRGPDSAGGEAPKRSGGT